MSRDTGARPFVGRKRELGAIRRAVEDASAGRAGVLLIGGEAGVGKSRLLEEAGARASDAGVEVVWGRAWEAGGAPPFWPWLQVIRAHLRNLSPDQARSEIQAESALLAQLLPELLELVPELPAPPAADEAGARPRLFEAVSSFFRRAGQRQPVVVILEDLHAVDPSSLLLLRYLSGELTGARVLIAGAYREEELSAGSAERSVIGDILRQAHVRLLPVGGLSRTDISAYVRRFTGRGAVPNLVARLTEETEGNALFVTEVVRDLEMQGRLGRDSAATLDQLRVPETVRDVIQRRLRRLSTECRDVLAIGAVIGREFDLSTLAAASGLETEAILERLDEALEARVLVETETPLRFRFSHVVIRDVVYDMLPGPKRLSMHKKVGEVLEGISGARVDGRASEIAHHMLLAGPLVDPARTIGYLMLAGEHALLRLAYEEAVRQFLAGLAELERANDDVLRVQLLLGLGDALSRSGDATSAKERFLQAARLAERLGTGEPMARAALGYGGRFVWEASRGDPHLVHLLTSALEAVKGEDSTLRARLLARLAAGPLRDEADRTRRARLSAEAVDIARRLDDLPTLAYVLDGRYAAMWGPDALEERVQIASELIDTSRLVGDRERELQGHHYLCLARLEAADLAGAEREAAEQRRLAGELRQPAQQFYAMTVDATIAAMQGRYAEADALIPQALAIGQRAERTMSAIYALFGRYVVARDRGTAASHLPELLDFATALPVYVVVQSLVADAYTVAGRPDDARRVLARLAQGGFSAIPRNDEWLFAMTTLADVAADLAEAGVAEPLFALLLPFEDRAAVSSPDACIGSVARVLGRLAALLGRESDAVGQFERALEINAQLNARPWLARTQLQFAEVLLRSGDRERAVELLQAAASTADGLGMAWLGRNAHLLLGEAAPSQRVIRTFLFTDIVKSTELLTAIGDEAWESVLRWHDHALRELFAARGGEEIHHAGDGFFVAFESAQAAIDCAIAIQQRLEEHRKQAGFAPAVRIGMHTQQARSGSGNYQGRGVHQAARIGAAADGGEILVSRATLAGLGDPRVSEERLLTLKGFADPVQVAVIDWSGRGSS